VVGGVHHWGGGGIDLDPKLLPHHVAATRNRDRRHWAAGRPQGDLSLHLVPGPAADDRQLGPRCLLEERALDVHGALDRHVPDLVHHVPGFQPPAPAASAGRPPSPRSTTAQRLAGWSGESPTSRRTGPGDWPARRRALSISAVVRSTWSMGRAKAMFWAPARMATLTPISSP